MPIILPEQRISYFPVPKIACTSLKNVFYEIENGMPFKEMRRNGNKFHIHHFYNSVLFRPVFLKSYADSDRFAVVRDPVKRLLSCYSNRVVFHKELNPKRIDQAARKAGAIPNPTLEDFVERLEIYRQHSQSIKHHSETLVNFLGPDKGFYSKIYQMSELSNFISDLEERLDMKLNLQHKQNGGPKLNICGLSSNAIEKIQKFYASDYEAYSFE